MSSREAVVTRADGRAADAVRPTELLPYWLAKPPGSALIKLGATWVLCTVTLEDRVPHWLRGAGSGWLTASYTMLPGSTAERTQRERRGARGRTLEIERLIARSLRGAVDLEKLGEKTLHVDCDVLQADGGTRTAAVTGGWLALALAVRELLHRGQLIVDPITRQLAAVSVGVVEGEPLLDLDYDEDVRAETDMNVVMTAGGRFVEVQGTAEGTPFARSEFEQMLVLAGTGTRLLLDAQMEVFNGL